MFASFLKGVLTFIFAFSLGASFAQEKPATDSELQQKVQDHMDVIVDESAAIVDDVIDEVKGTDEYQKAEQFVGDVGEVVENTANDIKEHFGGEDETEALSESDAAVAG